METLTTVVESGTDLGPKLIDQAIAGLLSTEVSDGEKMHFLKALRAKGESAGEIAGFAKGMLAHALPTPLGDLPGPTLDVCGTGGDRRGYFNVSTAVMFVAAAAGACVMKHGNRSVTSKSGAADVLEELGVKIEITPEELRDNLQTHGVAFLFAPAFHPAFKVIGPVRKALATQGVTTIFNILGPLLNPARPDYQLVGVYHADLLPKYAEALKAMGRKHAWAVHGDGTDELTLTGPTLVRGTRDGKLLELTLTPEEYGLTRCAGEALLGGDRVANARILLDLLDGNEKGPKREMVLLNVAASLVICGLAPDIRAGLHQAAEAIDSGAAKAKLEALRKK